MKRQVVITGFGLLTPFGFGEKAVVEHILQGEHAFRKIQRFDPTPYRSLYAAESVFSGSLLDLGLRCTGEALKMAGLEKGIKGSLFLGTNGDFNAIHGFWRESLQGEKCQQPLVESVPAYHAERIASEYGIHGRRFAFTNACVASSNAITYGYDRIINHQDEVAVCGGYYLVNEEFTAKFNSGRALSEDGQVRPFSSERSGLLLGDGAAIFVLESKEHAEQRGAVPLAGISGVGLACDAYHVCQPHPEGKGMTLAIEKALRSAGIPLQEIDYINAHGTGTKINDPSETRAIKAAFGDLAYRVPISSTKSMTGHILEGTGAVETAICMIAMKYNIIPPTVGYVNSDPECDLDYVPNLPRSKQLVHVMNLNAAFGGNNSAIILKKLNT